MGKEKVSYFSILNERELVGFEVLLNFFFRVLWSSVRKEKIGRGKIRGFEDGFVGEVFVIKFDKVSLIFGII